MKRRDGMWNEMVNESKEKWFWIGIAVAIACTIPFKVAHWNSIEMNPKIERRISKCSKRSENTRK